MIVTSPSKVFSGTVELPDGLTFPQYRAWLNGLDKCVAVRKEIPADDPRLAVELYAALLPAIFQCVTVWRIAGFPEGVTADTIPATPHNEVLSLLSAICTAVGGLISGADTAPKG